jgi:hypothetical protein
MKARRGEAPKLVVKTPMKSIREERGAEDAGGAQDRDEAAGAIDPKGAAAIEPSRALLDQVRTPSSSADVTLTSGRRYELRVEEGRDRLTVRSRGGDVVLRIEVTDEGPVLSFSGASIDLVATRRLRLAADEVSVQASGDLAIEAGGSLRETIGGDHHTRVGGDERLEASAVEVQASAGSVGVRAMQKIALDGEHIGLNDDPLPQPFPWSSLDDDDT